MPNLWATFKALLPQSPLLLGQVVEHHEDGTSTVQLPDGAFMRVRGQGVEPGSKAFIRDGALEGEAPNLPTYLVEV